MKLPCKVIEDMLPMYYDKVCSEESAALVEEHLRSCPRCAQMLADLGAEIDIPDQKVDDMKPLQKIRKSYRKMKLVGLIALLCALILVPCAFLIGLQKEPAVEYSQEEAIAYANEFMTCLVNGDYTKAYSYWDITGEKKDLLSGNLFTEKILQPSMRMDWKSSAMAVRSLKLWAGLSLFSLLVSLNRVTIIAMEQRTILCRILSSLTGKMNLLVCL